MLLAMWVTLVGCLEVGVEVGLLGVEGPIDVVTLGNQSLVIANRTQLYLFDAVGK